MGQSALKCKSLPEVVSFMSTSIFPSLKNKNSFSCDHCMSLCLVRLKVRWFILVPILTGSSCFLAITRKCEFHCFSRFTSHRRARSKQKILVTILLCTNYLVSVEKRNVQVVILSPCHFKPPSSPACHHQLFNSPSRLRPFLSHVNLECKRLPLRSKGKGHPISMQCSTFKWKRK